MRVLLAIDASASCESVIGQVAIRPWPGGTRFCALHVVDLFHFPSQRATGPDSLLIDKQVRAGESLVRRAVDKLSSHRLNVAAAVIKGYPPTGILDYAAYWGADFIVIGSQGSGKVRRFLLGGVAQTVVRHAHCSVEIVRPGPDQTGESAFKKIVLAIDGSEFSLAAAQSVADRPWPDKAEVKAVCVIHVPDPVTESWEGASEAISRIEGEYFEEAEEDLTAASKILAGAGLDVTTAVLEGYPKTVILEEADRWEADLVVVGSHGRRGVSRLVMGSVSEAVAMHAHCSVEVIRRNKISQTR
jgi:nucleotide-binding universal stress UspA family protein